MLYKLDYTWVLIKKYGYYVAKYDVMEVVQTT